MNIELPPYSFDNPQPASSLIEKLKKFLEVDDILIKLEMQIKRFKNIIDVTLKDIEGEIVDRNSAEDIHNYILRIAQLHKEIDNTKHNEGYNALRDEIVNILSWMKGKKIEINTNISPTADQPKTYRFYLDNNENLMYDVFQ